MVWEDSGYGLRGAAAREARKARAEEKAKDAEIALVNDGPTGEEARKLRKQKALEKEKAVEEEKALTGAAARQKRKQEQEAKEQAEKKLKEDQEAARLRRIAKRKENAANGDEKKEEDEEARKKRLAEKIAARRAALREREQAEGEGDDEEEEDEDDEEDSEEEEQEAAKESSDSSPEDKKKKAAKKKAGSASASSDEDKKAKKKKKKDKKKKKKKKKKLKARSFSSPSSEAMRMAKVLAMQDAGCFSWEKPMSEELQKQFTVEDFGVTSATATAQEVDDFLAQCAPMETEVALRFRSLPPGLQRLVCDRGPIINSRNPSAVLGARCRDAELGKLGRAGQKGPEKNPWIEKIIEKYTLDKNCVHRLRHDSKELQEVIIRLERMGDLDQCTNVSGLIMAKMNEVKPAEWYNKDANHQVVVYKR